MFKLKRIAIFTAFYPPHFDQVARYTYYMAQELQSMDVEVAVITTGRNDELKVKKADGITVYYLPAKYVGDKFCIPKIKDYKTIINILKEFRPDAVVANDYYRLLTLQAARAASELDIHALVINHLTDYVQVKNKTINKWLNIYEKQMIKRLRKKPVVFAATSQAQKDWLGHYSTNARFIISDAADINLLPALGMRRRLSIEKSTTVFAVSSDILRDEIKSVIEAFKKSNSWSGPDMHMVVYGKVDKENKKRDQNITYTGELSVEDMHSLLYESDVYISRSKKKEGLPIDIIEAGILSCAVLCLSEGREHILLDEKSGVLADEGDIKEISAKIQRLRVHSDKREKYAKALKNKVELRYNWTQSALALVDAICEMKGRVVRRQR